MASLFRPSGSAPSGWLFLALLALPFLILASPSPLAAQVAQVRVQIVETEGSLTVEGEASTDAYIAYFHIPVPNDVQIPLWLEVESPQLIDYRYIRTTGRNVLVAARMNSAPTAPLNWRCWVLVDQFYYGDIPEFVPMTMLADLPDSVLPYLQATATAQVDCQPVQDKVAPWSSLISLNFVTDLIAQYCNGIPFTFDHSPTSFCAFYTLNWGNSCTGHAHTATALLRAMGIPARTKLSLITWYNTPYDMHWTTDYYVPDYGWVTMEPTTGDNPLGSQQQVVTYQCEPADEFPLIFDHGIDGFWHTSDPALGGRNPQWGSCHQAVDTDYAYTDSAIRDQLMILAREVFGYEAAYRGVELPADEAERIAAADASRAAALDRLRLGDAEDGVMHLQAALAEYAGLRDRPRITVFESGFEEGPLEWAHGGRTDPWEWGAPGAPGPAAARNGSACWATGLDSEYPNNADAWLEAPPISLEGLASAQLEFWTWILSWGTYTQGDDEGLSLEISTDGVEYVPLCGVLRGGNDDPLIPVVTGWGRMDLDLTPWVGETVRIRYRFTSDGSKTRAGVYIDDMKVTGLAGGATPVPDGDMPVAARTIRSVKAVPNPFNPRTRIVFVLAEPLRTRIAVYDMAGKRVATLVDGPFETGERHVVWNGTGDDGRALPSGAYLARIEAGEDVRSTKLMLVR